MKKLVILALICAATVTAQAQKHHELTDDQKAVQKEMLAKYDANKDGKLDKEERAKMSAEDKAKWEKAFPHKKKKTDDSAAAAPAK